MAVFEQFTRITSAGTWTLVASTIAGETLDFDFLISNQASATASISVAMSSDTSAPTSNTEHIIQNVSSEGTLVGSELIGANRGMWVKSDKTDTRIRAAGIKE